MNIILRHMVSTILYSLLLTIGIGGVVFIAFPIKDWSLIWTMKILDLPFLFYVLSIPVVAGGIVGLSTGWYWRQRLKYLDKELAHLVKGHKLSSDSINYPELETITEHLNQLQLKIREQTEHSQRLATERTQEREKSLQEIVAQERNRLARELHDSVSQQLFAASMMMSAINETNPPKDQKMKRQLQMVEKMIHQSQLEMRALLLHLRPVALKGKSLQEGSEELLVELTQKVPLQINWKIEPFHADKGIEDQLFRILQESISNTLRHAKASSLDVLLIKRDDLIILRIVDDGIGFNMNDIRASAYGLNNMRERASELGGNFKVVSLPDEGTRIEVKIPIINQEGDSRD